MEVQTKATLPNSTALGIKFYKIITGSVGAKDLENYVKDGDLASALEAASFRGYGLTRDQTVEAALRGIKHLVEHDRDADVIGTVVAFNLTEQQLTGNGLGISSRLMSEIRDAIAKGFERK